MATYRVLINGQNFWLNFEGRPRRVGFYVTRYVDAADSRDAENVAIRTVKQDPKLSGQTLNEQSDPPMLLVDEIEEVSSIGKMVGFTLYPEDDQIN